jgi:predicted extracellular nuclease
MQDPTGDGDVTTSDGIFVFTFSPPVLVGDLVRLSGLVTEYVAGDNTRPITELTSISGLMVSFFFLDPIARKNLRNNLDKKQDHSFYIIVV